MVIDWKLIKSEKCFPILICWILNWKCIIFIWKKKKNDRKIVLIWCITCRFKRKRLVSWGSRSGAPLSSPSTNILTLTSASPLRGCVHACLTAEPSLSIFANGREWHRFMFAYTTWVTLIPWRNHVKRVRFVISMLAKWTRPMSWTNLTTTIEIVIFVGSKVLRFWNFRVLGF